RRMIGTQQREEQALRRDRRRLDNERLKLMQAHYAGAVPLDLLRNEQIRLSVQIEVLDRKLARLGGRLSDLESRLTRHLDYLANARESYRRGGPSIRRQINQAMFERVEITDEGLAE